jgi:hypothetical protein
LLLKFNMGIILGEAKWEKLKSIPEKYMPPKQKDKDGNEIPWADDPKTAEWLAIYAANTQENERMAKLRANEQEEQQRAMEQREKKLREENEPRLQDQKTLPARQYKMIVSGERIKCPSCHLGMFYEAKSEIPSRYIYCWQTE